MSPRLLIAALLIAAGPALAAPPAVVHDPLGLGPTAVPHAWWGAEPLDGEASMALRPVVIEPPLCGRFAAPQTYAQTPDWVFVGTVLDGDPAGPLSIQRGDDAGSVRGWQVLGGSNLWTGETAVVGPAVLSVEPPFASADISLGRRSLLCVHEWDASIPAVTEAAATLTTGSGGSTIVWTAATAGEAGNEITVHIPGDSGLPLNSAVCAATGTSIVIRQYFPTNQALISAVAANPACAALLVATSANPTAAVPAIFGPTALSGGADEAPAYEGGAIAADWTPAAGTAVTWTDPPAVLHVAGEITDASRLSLTVEQAPPIYPTPLIEADGGITGTPSIASLPAGWQVRQTATTLYLEPIP